MFKVACMTEKLILIKQPATSFLFEKILAEVLFVCSFLFPFSQNVKYSKPYLNKTIFQQSTKMGKYKNINVKSVRNRNKKNTCCTSEDDVCLNTKCGHLGDMLLY